MIDLKAKPFWLNDKQIGWVETTIANMTLDEKIGQLFMIMTYLPGVDDNKIKGELDAWHQGGLRWQRKCADDAYAQNPNLLLEFNKEHDFLICVDSDGCVFDAMEIKHKECFIPNTINEWELQSISKYARETAEFVNLYSKWRGTNRFPALAKVLHCLPNGRKCRPAGISRRI